MCCVKMDGVEVAKINVDAALETTQGLRDSMATSGREEWNPLHGCNFDLEMSSAAEVY